MFPGARKTDILMKTNVLNVDILDNSSQTKNKSTIKKYYDRWKPKLLEEFDLEAIDGIYKYRKKYLVLECSQNISVETKGGRIEEKLSNGPLL